MRSSYDVIVVGRELSATIAAALLSQRGLRVLAISGPGEPLAPAPAPGRPAPIGDRYELGPYVLPTAPMHLVGPDGPGIRGIIAELNLVQLFRRRIEPNRPAFQLLLPDQRIDVDDELLHALEREAPTALAGYEQVEGKVAEISSAVESILAEEVMLPPEGFWDRRDGKRVASRLPDDDDDLLAPIATGEAQRGAAADPARERPPLTEARAAQVAHALLALPTRFYTDLAEPGAIATARAAELWRRGSYRIDGGREGLRALFLERLRAQGGEHRPELRAERLVIRRGRVVAVDVGAPEGEIGCEHVVAGLTADALLPLFGEEKPPKRVLEAAQWKPALYRYLLHLVVPLDVLPDALGRVAFSVRDPRADLVGDNALSLHLADGYGQHAVLSAEALTPDPAPAALAKLRAGVRAHLDALLPFVDRHLLCVHSPHDGLPPEGLAEAHADAAAPPRRALDPLWDPPRPRVLGICGLGYDTGLRGLLLVGRQTLPGLGLEGELEAAARVAKLVSAGAKKRVEASASLGP